MKKIYLVHFSLGLHHKIMETVEKDFYSIIDDLSKEFTIIKRERETNLKYIDYYIENYYGDFELIGSVIEV